MAVNHIFQRGWLDTAESIRGAFMDDHLVRSLKTRRSTIPVTHDELSLQGACKWAYLVSYGAYRVQGGKMPAHPHIQAVAIGELIAPVLPENYFLSMEDANAAVRDILAFYADNETVITRGRTKATFIIANNEVLRAEDLEEGADVPAPIPNDITTENFIAQYAGEFADFLLVEGNNDPNLGPLEIFTTLYVSVAKRGTVSEAFVDKIIRGIADDLQQDIRLSSEIAALVYKFYGGFITAANARIVLDRWLADIPEHALRVRLTLQQATNSGLTALVVIGRAMLKYQDFPWARLNSLTGGELTNFHAAVTLVNGNQYYGFNKTLGAARSTLYSSIAYVAKELLIGLNGESSLKNYAGWIRAPKNSAVIKAMIDTYKQEYTTRLQEGEIAEADNNISDATLAEIRRPVNANLFS